MTTTNSHTIIHLDEGLMFVETMIAKLKRILEGIPEPEFNKEDYMMLFTNIYNMCLQPPPHDYSQQLYDYYTQVFEEYIHGMVLPPLREKHDEFMLRELVKQWEKYKVMVRWISGAFGYLDRFFVVTHDLPKMEEQGIILFREMGYPELKGKAKDAIISLIDRERESEQIDRALLRNVLDMYLEIGMGQMEYYVDDFEKDMLLDSANYYSQKASKWIVEDSCPSYMLKVEDCLRKEKDRLSHYLHSRSEPKLLENVRNALLVAYNSELLENEHSGCHSLLRDDKVDDLSRMHKSFSKIDKGLDPIAQILKQHIAVEGMAIVRQTEEDAAINREYMRKLIELHEKCMTYVTDCFRNNTLTHKAVKDAFEVFLNKDVAGCNGAELLASYCDIILKKIGSKKLIDEAIEENLDMVVRLLMYIHDKDLFMESYRKMLSPRLLFDSSTNDEHERLVLSKLKQQFGGQFISKMDAMVTDLALAKGNSMRFKSYIANNPTAISGVDLNVMVLTTCLWPSHESSSLTLPIEMVQCVETFKDFYKIKDKHDRRLKWIYSLGTCIVNGHFEKKTVELVLGTYQAALLMLFNKSDGLSYSEIKAQLNLADEDAMRLLKSLSCGKYKILNKDPRTKIVSQTDYFKFNSNFTDRMKRIRVPLLHVDETKVVEEVHNDRRYAIDATIVRIMKFRKTLLHQQLVLECSNQLKSMFEPNLKAIEKGIEDLIEREYIGRDKDNQNLYKYLA